MNLKNKEFNCFSFFILLNFIFLNLFITIVKNLFLLYGGNMVYDVDALLNHINRIRKEIGHEEVNIDIKEVLYDKDTNEMWIITNDRPDKSAIIGKGGWVVGRLREELQINSIHVESFSDFLQKEYRMNLSLKKLNSFSLINLPIPSNKLSALVESLKISKKELNDMMEILFEEE